MIFTDSLEFLIGIQIVVFLLLVIGLLALLLRRQKKVIQDMQVILMEYRDDLSGNTLMRHLKQEIDNTTAQCRQDTIALKAELSPEDMAVSLRYSALETELLLMQESQHGKPRWRDQIKRYEELAQSIHDIVRARGDHVSQTLQEAHNQTLAEKDQQIQLVSATCQDLQQQLAQLKPLQTFIRSVTEAGLPQNEMEQKLHRTLLDLCDNFDDTEKLRELVFLLHETYHQGPADEAESTPA